MAKEEMICPITKGICVNCPIYRGRHYYMCYSKTYKGCLLDKEKIDETESKSDKKMKPRDLMPEKLPASDGRINNVEEIVIGLDFDKS